MQAVQNFFAQYGSTLVTLILEHLYISFLSIALGVIAAVPLGVILTRLPDRIANFFITIVSILQTVPSLALLALMIPILGVGFTPAVVALFIYSLLPILRNTYAGISGVDKNLVDAARGMGMTDIQLLTKVELPQAAPVIMAGIRLSTTYVISWAALAAYIGAGGLGDFIFNGLNNYIPELIIGGTVPVTLIALTADLIFRVVEKKVTPANIDLNN